MLAIIHDLTLAMRFADRVVLMNEGRIVANDTPPLALTPDRIAAVFGISVNCPDRDHPRARHGPPRR